MYRITAAVFSVLLAAGPAQAQHLESGAAADHAVPVGTRVDLPEPVRAEETHLPEPLAVHQAAQPLSVKQGVLLGAAAGCVAGGLLLGRSATDSRGAAAIVGCALGAPLGAIAGLFAALGSR